MVATLVEIAKVSNSKKIQMAMSDKKMLMEVTTIQTKKVTTDTIMLITPTGMNTTSILKIKPTPTKTVLEQAHQAHTSLMDTLEKTSQVCLTFIRFYFMYYFKW